MCGVLLDFFNTEGWTILKLALYWNISVGFPFTAMCKFCFQVHDEVYDCLVSTYGLTATLLGTCY